MPSNTPNLNLYKKNPATDGDDTFNIETMLNENFDKIDSEVQAVKTGKVANSEKGAVNGVATLGANGKVTPAQLVDATTGAKGVVQLTDGVTSTSTTTAATAAAAKTAYDRAVAAETNANGASIPKTEKGAASGVAALNEIGQVMGSGLSLGGNKLGESVFTFSFAHSVPNQKINLVHTGLTAGFVEVTVAGTWVNGNAAGKLTKRYEIITDGGGTISYQTDAYTEVTGPIQDAISISPISWDSSASTLKITIEARTSNGNDYVVSIKQMSPHGYVAWSKGTVYTGAATILPRAVQTIPDDTVTRSGYLIQKHRLTTPTGTVINLSTGYNLNDLTVNGFFDGESFVNAPNASTDWFYIESYVHSNNQWDYRLQRATTLNGTPTRKPTTFERIQVGGVWGNWIEVSGDSIFKTNGIVDVDYNQYTKPGYIRFTGLSPQTVLH